MDSKQNEDWNNLLKEDRLRESSSKEQQIKADYRNPFESDFGRVIFSPASRRLHDKTQVFPLTSDDNIHSRLTHSIEVMNIGLSFAINLANNSVFKKKSGLKDVDILRTISPILKTSCLVHDIGNPPFGHYGEDVIQQYFKVLIEELERLIGGGHSYHKIANIIFKSLKEKPVFTIEELEKSVASVKEIVEKKDGAEEEKKVVGELEKSVASAKEIVEKKDGAEEEKKVVGELEKSVALAKKIVVNNAAKFAENEIKKFCEGCLKYDYIYFDGNAEGFRILCKLQYAGDLYGLNLTKGTLASSIKYPNTGKPDKKSLSKHKHGVFTTEKDELDEIAKDCGLKDGDNIKRHPLSFLMEAADSICYEVMDIEDGFGKKWYKVPDIIDHLCDEKEEKIDSDFKEKLITLKGDENKSATKKMIDLRTELIAYLMTKSTNKFVEKLDDIQAEIFKEELIEKDPVSKKLGEFCKNNILNKREIVSLEITGKAVIFGLFDNYLEMLFSTEKKVRNRVKTMISKSIFLTVLHEHFKDVENINIEEEYKNFDVQDFTMEERFRLVRDYVACMTDKFALSHYQKISGQKI